MTILQNFEVFPMLNGEYKKKYILFHDKYITNLYIWNFQDCCSWYDNSEEVLAL